MDRLCIRCTRPTSTGLRLVGDQDFLASRLRALGLPQRRAEKIAAGEGRKRLSVALCRSCARPLSLPVGANPPTIEQPESVGEGA